MLASILGVFLVWLLFTAFYFSAPACPAPTKNGAKQSIAAYKPCPSILATRRFSTAQDPPIKGGQKRI
jgi:hypothetical protein